MDIKIFNQYVMDKRHDWKINGETAIHNFYLYTQMCVNCVAFVRLTASWYLCLEMRLTFQWQFEDKSDVHVILNNAKLYKSI